MNYLLYFLLFFILYFLYNLKFYKSLFKGKNDRGFIYFITEIGFVLPFIKIGKTKNLDQRLKPYRTGTPIGVVCLLSFYTPAMSKSEALLHSRYRLRLNGEWFLSFFIFLDIFNLYLLTRLLRFGSMKQTSRRKA